MKKLFFIVSLMLFFSTTFLSAQEFEKVFLGNNYYFYKNCLFTLPEKPYESVLYDLYFEMPDTTPHKLREINKTRKKPSMKLVAGRIFRVTDIVVKGALSSPVFVLEDIDSKQILYYVYSKAYARIDDSIDVIKDEIRFPFLSKDIEYTEEAAKKHLDRTKDSFTGDISIFSPIANITITKSISGGASTYYLRLRSYSKSCSVSVEGVNVLFDDGTVWKKDESVDTKAGKGEYFDYSAFIRLTSSDLELFSTKKAEKIRLYIYDKSIAKQFSSIFPLYVKAIMNAE